MASKSFTFALLLAAGTLLLASPSVAKPGGGFHGFHGKAWHFKHHFAKPHVHAHGLAHADRLHARRFHHHRRVFAFGYYPYAPVADPVIYEVPRDEASDPGAVTVWRGNHLGGCRTERVPVSTSHGEGEVRVIRCGVAAAELPDK